MKTEVKSAILILLFYFVILITTSLTFYELRLFLVPTTDTSTLKKCISTAEARSVSSALSFSTFQGQKSRGFA